MSFLVFIQPSFLFMCLVCFLLLYARYHNCKIVWRNNLRPKIMPFSSRDNSHLLLWGKWGTYNLKSLQCSLQDWDVFKLSCSPCEHPSVLLTFSVKLFTSTFTSQPNAKLLAFPSELANSPREMWSQILSSPLWAAAVPPSPKPPGRYLLYFLPAFLVLFSWKIVLISLPHGYWK